MNKRPPNGYILEEGKQIDDLFLLKKHREDREYGRSYYWTCKCSCGKIISRSISYMQYFNNLSCGCKKKKNQGKKNPRWKGHEDISGEYFNALKHGAKSRNLDFNITIIDIWNQYVSQNKQCNLSGQKLIFNFKRLNNNASVDRIDSNQGYVKTNIQIIHKDINKMKNNLNQKYFTDLCTKISNYQALLLRTSQSHVTTDSNKRGLKDSTSEIEASIILR